MTEEPRHNKGLVKATQYFIAGRSNAVLLFWVIGDFRCGVLLFIVILVIYINIEEGKNRCYMLD